MSGGTHRVRMLGGGERALKRFPPMRRRIVPSHRRVMPANSVAFSNPANNDCPFEQWASRCWVTSRLCNASGNAIALRTPVSLRGVSDRVRPARSRDPRLAACASHSLDALWSFDDMISGDL